MSIYKKSQLAFLSIIYFFGTCCGKELDFEEQCQDFVIETRQLIIPNYPEAFNPSIVAMDEGYLMCFRFRDKLTKRADKIGLIRLDKNFRLCSAPQELKLKFEHASNAWAQDPRLIEINEELYIVFSTLGELKDPLIRRVCIAKIQKNESEYFITNPQTILYFEGENPKRHEKNWSPFVYQNEMYLIYSILPHRIFRLSHLENTCDTLATSEGSILWNWGELRGGTTALLDGEEYLTIFHSCKALSSKHSLGAVRDHYFMGAYTFAKEPPFEITRISPEPIVGKNFYHGKLHNTWKPLHVVFPAGCIIDKNHVWISYGRQDHEIWIAKLDKKKLIDSLTPVQTIRAAM